jgi:hypothetical protein
MHNVPPSKYLIFSLQSNHLTHQLTQSFTATELSRPRAALADDDQEGLISTGDAPRQSEVIIGGSMMEPRDALRIGKSSGYTCLCVYVRKLVGVRFCSAHLEF